MSTNLQSRKDQALPTSKEMLDQKQIEQIFAKLLPANPDQLTTEQLEQQNRELRAFIMGMSYSQSLGYSEIKQMLQTIEQDEVQRDQKLLRQVKFTKNVVMFIKRRVTKLQPVVELIKEQLKPTLYGTLATTLFGSLWIMLFQEVVKLMVEEQLKAAALLLKLAAPEILNHAVSIWPSARKSLGLVKSIFTSN